MGFPQTVENFVKNHIQSVWQLELLLYMRAVGRPMTVGEIASALYMNTDVITAGVLVFEKAKLLKRSDDSKTFVYAPANSALTDAVDQTAKCYVERRVAIINLIFSGPLKTFSDAFKFRQEDE